MKVRVNKKIAAVAVLGLLMTGAGRAIAGPPLATDDANTVDVGKVEIELNGSYAHDREKSDGVETAKGATNGEMKITTGIYKNIGISLVVPYTFSNRERVDGVLASDNSGFGDMAMEVKYRFIELGGINFAIKPRLIMPTGRYSNGLSEGRWQFGATLIATKEFQEGKYVLHANLGYEHHDYRTEEAKSATRSDLWSGSVAGEAKVLEKLTAVADFGLKTTADKSTREITVYSLLGARYEINDRLDVNAGVKIGLTRPEDDITALYGVVLKF